MFLPRRTLVAVVVAAGVMPIGFAISPSAAAVSAMSTSASPSSVVAGAVVHLVAKQPVAGAGTSSQRIVQHLDRAHLHLTSASQVEAPEGWKVSYSTDGNTFTNNAPTTSAGWAAVTDVAASGHVTSADPIGGQQVNIGTEKVSLPVAGGTAFSGSTGDGYDVSIDARGHIFNITHQPAPNAQDRRFNQLDCHTRDGHLCSPAFPMDLLAFGFRPMNLTSTYLDGTGDHLWTPQIFGNEVGFACIDVTNINAPELCGGSFESAFVPLGTQDFRYPGDYLNIGSVALGGKLYVYDIFGTEMDCLDPSARDGLGAPCAGQPYSLGKSDSGSHQDPWNEHLRVLDGKILTETVDYNDVSSLTCFDPAVGGTCNGWPSGGHTVAGDAANLLIMPDRSGTPSLACLAMVSSTDFPCWDAQGQSVQSPSNPMEDLGGGTYYLEYGNSVLVGTRVYFVISSENNHAINRWDLSLFCWDVAAGSHGAWCPGWGKDPSTGLIGRFSSEDPYTVMQDPVNPSCLWQNGDKGKIIAFQLNGKVGCPAHVANLTQSFTPDVMVPRLACGGGNDGVTAWGRFQLSDAVPGAGSTAAELTVLDSSGAAVPGYQHLSIPADGQVDLSGMSVAASGQTPTFQVHFTDLIAATASATVQAIGASPELCVTAEVSYACPSGAQQLSSLPTQSAVAVASGSAKPTAGGSSTDFTPASSSVDVVAPSLGTCIGRLEGTALDVAGRPVQGATVELLDGTGAPVLLAGTPITVTTGYGGSYTFGNLATAAYQVRFSDLSSQTKVRSATVVSPGTASSTASGGKVTSASVGVAVGSRAIVDATYDLHPAAKPDSSAGHVNTPQTIDPLANDAPSDTSSFDATSFYLCGISPAETPPACTQRSLTTSAGSYSVTGTGTPADRVAVTFTPNTGWVGTDLPVVYQVTDTLGHTDAATMTFTVGPPPTASPDHSVGAAGTTQIISPLDNDTAVPGDDFDHSTLYLCDPTVPEQLPGCTRGSVTVNGVGTWTTKNGGKVEFRPEVGYVGTTSISYQVADASGQVTGSTITVEVLPPPTASPIRSAGPAGIVQWMSPVGSATPGGAGDAMVPSSLRLCGRSPAQHAPDCSLTNLELPGTGTFQVTASGLVGFTPAPGFVGTVPTIGYQLSDEAGLIASSTIDVFVSSAPSAAPVVSSGPMDQVQTMEPIASATSSDGAPFVTGTLGICGESSDNNHCQAPQRSFEIPDEGTFRVDLATGLVHFTPVRGFVGKVAQVTFSVTDSASQAVSSTIDVTVTPMSPPTPSPTGGALAMTGAPLLTLFGSAAVALGLGLCLLIVGQRRRVGWRRR